MINSIYKYFDQLFFCVQCKSIDQINFMSPKFYKKAKSLYKNFIDSFSTFKDKAEDYFDDDDLVIREPRIRRSKVHPKESIKVEISARSVVKVTLIILSLLMAAYVSYKLVDVIFMIILSILIASAFFPAVAFIERRGFPRILSILIVYLAFFFIIAFVLYNIIPIIAVQLASLSRNVSVLLDSLSSDVFINIPVIGKSLNSFIVEFKNYFLSEKLDDRLELTILETARNLSLLSGNSFSVIGNVFNGVYNFVVVLVLSFFLLVDAEFVLNFMYKVLPASYRDVIFAKAYNMHIKISHWVKGQLILCVVIGLGLYVGLFLIDLFIGQIPYKETIAIIGGILEIVPFLGPIITSLLIVVVVSTQGASVFIAALILSVLIQNFENNLIVPIVMKKAIGVPSLVIFIFILIGAKLLGVLGIFLAIPFVSILTVLFEDYFEKEEK